MAKGRSGSGNSRAENKVAAAVSGRPAGTEAVAILDSKGNEIFFKVGDNGANSVTLSEVNNPAFVASAASLTHNHPAGLSFSPDDGYIFDTLGLRSMGAFSKTHGVSYSMRDSGGATKGARPSAIGTEIKNGIDHFYPRFQILATRAASNSLALKKMGTTITKFQENLALVHMHRATQRAAQEASRNLGRKISYSRQFSKNSPLKRNMAKFQRDVKAEFGVDVTTF